jgi:hypothetical protein
MKIRKTNDTLLLAAVYIVRERMKKLARKEQRHGRPATFRMTSAEDAELVMNGCKLRLERGEAGYVLHATPSD